jgi:nucleoid DNA-binding protein
MVGKSKKRAVSAKSRKATKSKKSAVKVVKKKSVSVSKPYSKSQLVAFLTERTGLQRKQVLSVFVTLEEVIAAHLSGRGPGSFTLPGLLKMVVQHKPATKARKGINPFTGEPTIFKAKPARRIVKVRALKKLKEIVV